MKYASICLAALGLAGCTTKESEPGDTSVGRSVEPDAQGPASTPAEGPKGTAPTLRESIEYYDGAEKRKLWISKDRVAEFDPSDAGRDAVQRADPAAVEIEQAQKGVRIWRVRPGLDPGELSRATNAGSTRFSPVLHEGPAPGLPMRALPGGVVASFQSGWERARIDTWLAARGLRVESEVAPDANMFLVAAPPGLESLRIANELHESGELVDATPNFWQQATSR